MKKTYTSPDAEIIVFETEDIMTASGVAFDGSIGSWDDSWGRIAASELD